MEFVTGLQAKVVPGHRRRPNADREPGYLQHIICARRFRCCQSGRKPHQPVCKKPILKLELNTPSPSIDRFDEVHCRSAHVFVALEVLTGVLPTGLSLARS